MASASSGELGGRQALVTGGTGATRVRDRKPSASGGGGGVDRRAVDAGRPPRSRALQWR